MTKVRLLLGCSLVLVAGCYGSSNSFNKRAAKLACINMQECQKSAFEDQYDSLSECQEDVKGVYDGLFDPCDYDAKEGRKCIHKMYGERKECSTDDETDDALNEACEDVYDDCIDILDRAQPLDAAARFAMDVLPESVY